MRLSIRPPSRTAALIFGLVLLAGLAACTPAPAPAPTIDVEELAVALANTWATQTAEAAATAVPSPSATATAAEIAAAASTATATTVAAATPTTAPTLAPSATSVATQPAAGTGTPAPGCAVSVGSELAPAWDREKLGCPAAAAEVIWAAWQPFARGYMFWRSDRDWTYALTFANGDTTQGRYETGGDAWRWDNSFPEGRGLTPPAGQIEPIRGFGFVWFSKLDGPDSNIGWATEQEKGICVTRQEFERGVVIKSNTVAFCGDNLYNMAQEPAFAPVLLALHGDGTWRRY
jgi:hypothetical protein